MSFPNLKRKHKYEALVTPEAWIEFIKDEGKYEISKEIPENVIIIFSKTLLEKLKKEYELDRAGEPFEDLYFLPKTNIGVVCSEIGAANSTILVEELMALGVKKFIILGMAGSLQKDLEIGDVITGEKAIRDEGVSHHYIEPSKFAFPSEDLKKTVRKALEEAGIDFREGTIWTISTPYRETKKEIKKYREEGVLCVEMETSAIFAVTEKRGVDSSAIFVISDILDENWEPYFYGEEVMGKLKQIFSVLISDGF